MTCLTRLLEGRILLSIGGLEIVQFLALHFIVKKLQEHIVRIKQLLCSFVGSVIGEKCVGNGLERRPPNEFREVIYEWVNGVSWSKLYRFLRSFEVTTKTDQKPGSEDELPGHPQLYVPKCPTLPSALSLLAGEINCHRTPETHDVIQQKSR